MKSILNLAKVDPVYSAADAEIDEAVGEALAELVEPSVEP
jgi:hypothetical protein